jgi:Tfp pilus assembly protein PilX
MLMRRFVRPLFVDERGSTLAIVVMVSMVLGAVAIGVVATSQHTTNVTSVDRERLQAVQSAEAGVNDAVRRLSNGAGCDTQATPTQTLRDGTQTVGTFQTKILPEAGTVCGQTLKRVVHSWGFSPTGSGRAMRQLEVQVTLVPRRGFPYTLFADGNLGTLYVKNSGSISGDAYAEVVDQTKNNFGAINVITPGSFVSKNNAAYSGTLWAGGNITIGSSSSIGGSVIAAGSATGTAGTISLGSGTKVGQDAIARSTVTLGGNASVAGTILQNDPNVPPPPILHKPTYIWNPANYAPAPTQGTAAQITTALTSAANNLQGVYYASDATGTVNVPSGTVTGPLTIVSAGKIKLPDSLSANGGPFEVYFISLNTAIDAISQISSFDAASALDVLIFTTGGFDQNNSMNFRGAIYADSIDAKNTFTITKSIALQNAAPPGFTFDAVTASSYAAYQGAWREIVPGTPPS